MLQRHVPSCELTARMVHSFGNAQHALRHYIVELKWRPSKENRLRMILELKILKIAVRFLLQGHVAQPYTRSFMASLQRFVPATCPMKFNKLNSVQHVAGTKYPPNWCCAVKKVSVHTMGHVAATCPWDMYPQHFHVCANVVTLSLLHVPATCPCYMSPQCVLHTFFVPATCRCDMSLQHDPSCLPTYKLKSVLDSPLHPTQHKPCQSRICRQ